MSTPLPQDPALSTPLQIPLIYGVDAVHGLGVEAEAATELGCDVFIAGCHKWLLGPRGTGIVWAHPRAHGAISPTIPSFTVPPARRGGRAPRGTTRVR
jgi:selenocysteine lyase/cysteine desulfurase